MAQWLALIEKMVDTNRVTESRYALPSKYDPDQGHVPFRPGRYLASVGKDERNKERIIIWDISRIHKQEKPQIVAQ